MEEKKTKKRQVETIVERQFVGDVTPIQAILPIVLEDIRKKAEENRTMEKEKGNN